MTETLLEPCSWQRLATTQKRVLRTPTTVRTGGSVRSVDSECEGRVIELRKWDYSRAFGLPNTGGNIDALRRRRDRVRGRNEAPVGEPPANGNSPHPGRPSRLSVKNETESKNTANAHRGLSRNLRDPVGSATVRGGTAERRTTK